MNNILDAKYESAALNEVIKNSTNLDKAKKSKLYKLLLKYEDMFDGTLGKCKGTLYYIHFKNDVTPHHGKAYKIPHAYAATLKKKVERLCQIGVLKRQTIHNGQHLAL